MASRQGRSRRVHQEKQNERLPMRSGVYAIKNTVNSRMYVGSSNDMLVRWQCHISRLQQGKHHAHRLQQDWNEYGDHVFLFEVLEVVEPITQLHVVEQKWIDELNPYYNRRMTTGSTRRTIKPKKRVKELSKEHRQAFL